MFEKVFDGLQCRFKREYADSNDMLEHDWDRIFKDVHVVENSRSYTTQREIANYASCERKI